MNNKIISILSLLFIIGIVSCNKSEFLMYKQKAAVGFNTNGYTYSFMEDMGATQKTITLSAIISGNPAGYDREFFAKVADDTLTITTATKEMYTLGKGIIPAGKYEGVLDVTLLNNKLLEDSTFVLCLEIALSKEFPEENLLKNQIKIEFTAMAIQPANWHRLSLFFGTYSARWWKFILEATNRTSLPYNPEHPDKETWNMTYGELIAYQGLVRIELDKYNSSHDKDLTHDDGANAGQIVIMP